MFNVLSWNQNLQPLMAIDAIWRHGHKSQFGMVQTDKLCCRIHSSQLGIICEQNNIFLIFGV